MSEFPPEKHLAEGENSPAVSGEAPDRRSESYRDASQLESQDDSHHHDSVELERIHTYRLQQQATIGSTRSRTPRDQWLSMGAGKAYPPALPNSDDYVVEFDGSDDPMHPQNWPMARR